MNEQEVHRGPSNYEVVRVPIRDATGRFAGWGYEHRHDVTAPQFITATDTQKRDPWTGAIVYDVPEPPAGPNSVPYLRPGGEPQPPPAPEQRDGRLLRDRMFSRESSVTDLVDLAVTGGSEMSGLAFELLERDDNTGGTIDLAADPAAIQALNQWATRHPDLARTGPGNAIDLSHSSDDGPSEAELVVALETIFRGGAGMAIQDVSVFVEETS